MVKVTLAVLFSIAITQGMEIEDILDLTYDYCGEEREVPTNIISSDEIDDIENMLHTKIIDIFKSFRHFDNKVQVQDWLATLKGIVVRKEKDR